MPDTPSPDLTTLFEHAQRITEAVSPPADRTGLPHVIVPENWHAQPLPWELVTPIRIKREVQLHDLDSFVRYVKMFQDEATAIGVMKGAGAQVSFLAILDYHLPENPRHCEHRVNFSPPLSEEWRYWSDIDKMPMTQGEFALFLENNLRDVTSPPGADLLHIINEFEVHGTTTYQKIQRLQNGTMKFHFQNEQSAKAGEMAVPENFTLFIPLWEGMARESIKARLRYRLGTAGDLKLFFELADLTYLIRSATQALIQSVEAQTGLTPLLGRI